MAAKTKTEQNLEDVGFISVELNRFLAMEPTDVIQHIREHPEDSFATLRGPRGHLFCGKAAYDRFESLADRTLQQGSAEAKNFDRADYVSALRTAFAEAFIERRERVTEGSVAKVVNRAKELGKGQLREVTHHLPCVIFYDENPSQFVVGPVTFTTTERFFLEQRQKLAEYDRSSRNAFVGGVRQRKPDLRESDVQAEADAFSKAHIGGIERYYRDYSWVGSVTIPPCHSSLSLLRAERTIDAALDVLRLFVPGSPERYRRANAPNVPFDTRELMTLPSGAMISSMRQGGRGGPAGPGWYESLQEHAPELWRVYSSELHALTVGDKPNELTQRLLDALNWFGQAVVETNPAGEVVKYTAALERLTITGHVASGLEALVIKRVAFLNSDRSEPSDTILEDLGALYQMRSDLMHGSTSPYDPRIEKILRIGWEVTRWALLRAALMFDRLRAEGKTGSKQLASAYDEGVAAAPGGSSGDP